MGEDGHDHADHRHAVGDHAHSVGANADGRYLTIALLLIVGFMVRHGVLASASCLQPHTHRHSTGGPGALTGLRRRVVVLTRDSQEVSDSRLGVSCSSRDVAVSVDRNQRG